MELALLRLKLMNARKELLSKRLGRLEGRIRALSYSVAERTRYREFVRNRFCIVCANRDPHVDFFIPDGIVCTHPCNQEGKDRYRCYTHTCGNWKKEKTDKR